MLEEFEFDKTPEDNKSEEPSLPEVEQWENHSSKHGSIVYDGIGMRCQKLECIVNKEPRNLKNASKEFS